MTDPATIADSQQAYEAYQADRIADQAQLDYETSNQTTMTGLQRTLRTYGRMTVKSGDKSVLWVWDYAKDEPRKASDMTRDEMAASERAKWEGVAEGIKLKKVTA